MQPIQRNSSDGSALPRMATPGSWRARYTRFCQRVFWPRLQTIVWLDLPLSYVLARTLRRSWRRWRSRELLWGTNREKFWPQLMLWRKQESLVWWVVTQHAPTRRKMRACMTNADYAHIRFIRLGSIAEIESFADGIGHTRT